jgi:thiol-disulfide isomerase/thioredoxin
MPTRRDALVLGAVALAAAGAGVVIGPLLLQSGSGAAELLARTFPDSHGKPRRLMEWQGRVVVCNFWATWCEPCREEVPLLIETREKYAPQGLEIVGISIDRVDKVKDFASKFKIGYPLLIADASALDLMKALGNAAGALPFTVILDRAGAVTYRKLGLLKAAELEKAIKPLLG